MPKADKQLGALAQLARAFDWQSRGHRFDSDMLHSEDKRVVDIKFATFFLFVYSLVPLQTLVKERFILSTSNLQLIP